MQQRTLSSTQKDAFLVGERGRVVAEIEDRGTVQVHGELWTARSRSRLESGTEVVVTQQDGLELHVEKAKRLKKRFQTRMTGRKKSPTRRIVVGATY